MRLLNRVSACICLLLSNAAVTAHAQTADRPVNDGVIAVPQIAPVTPQIGSPTATPQVDASDAAPPVQLGDDDLKKDPQLADMVLGQALRAHAWKIVEGILRYYREIPGHDPMMALYAQGALDRQQGRHSEAIAAYRTMVVSDETLDYVRLDLAAMLVENKQFREARQQFAILRNDRDLAPTGKQAVEQYLDSVQRQEGWHGTVRLGHKYNDNVNQASADPYIYLFGLKFEKDPESLPRSASGVTYFAELTRDINLGGNHFVGLGAAVNGDHYWDDRTWRETNASVQAGYRHRDIRSWLSIMPSYGRAWLGEKPYRRDVSIGLEYGRWLSPKWQMIANYTWLNKKYDNAGFQIYGGDLHALAATAVWFKSPRTILYGGLSAQRDLLKVQDESSSRSGASLGVIKLWSNGLEIRGNARYSFRRFRDYSLWDRTKIRRDHEYQLDFSATYSKLRFGGIYPRLSYQLLKIDSTIPSIYSRTGNQLTLSLETRF